MSKFDEYVQICKELGEGYKLATAEASAKATGDARFAGIDAYRAALINGTGYAVSPNLERLAEPRESDVDKAFELIFDQVRSMIAGKKSARVLFDAGVDFAAQSDAEARYTCAEVLQAVETERTRILAILETCRPTPQEYSRRDWAIEEKGKRDLFAKIMKALGEPVKEGGE